MSIDRVALQGTIEDFKKALLLPAKWCMSGRCKDTNWGGHDRLHYRSAECPAFDAVELQGYIEKGQRSLDRVDAAGLTDADLAGIREQDDLTRTKAQAKLMLYAGPRLHSHEKVTIRDLLAALEASQAEVVRLRTALDEAKRDRDRHGPCVCDTGPESDGPDEWCPRHGRPYGDALAFMDRMLIYATKAASVAKAKVARVEALLDETDRLVREDGASRLIYTAALRAALAVTSPPSEQR